MGMVLEDPSGPSSPEVSSQKGDRRLRVREGDVQMEGNITERQTGSCRCHPTGFEDGGGKWP